MTQRYQHHGTVHTKPSRVTLLANKDPDLEHSGTGGGEDGFSRTISLFEVNMSTLLGTTTGTMRPIPCSRGHISCKQSQWNESKSRL